MTDDRTTLTDRAAVDVLRRALARVRILFEVRDGDWRPADPAAPFDWDAPLPLSGAKRFFLPPREPLLGWRDGGAVVEEVVPDPAPFALFGLRACDLTAIAYQDRFFTGDPWYAARRARALLVGVNCLRACRTGFCGDVDAGPFARAGFDLTLTPLADGRVVLEPGSAAGRAAVALAGVPTRPLDAAGRLAFEAAAAKARAAFPYRPHLAAAVARINGADGGVADAEWQALGPACFACTGCTNLCPTCSCFTVVDEARGNAGERARYWDSCLLVGFQREASGHHPSPRPGDRVRRFWYHKFADGFAAEFGRPGCVGCGRCEVTCPGGIGALRVLGALGGR